LVFGFGCSACFRAARPARSSLPTKISKTTPCTVAGGLSASIRRGFTANAEGVIRHLTLHGRRSLFSRAWWPGAEDHAHRPASPGPWAPIRPGLTPAESLWPMIFPGDRLPSSRENGLARKYHGLLIRSWRPKKWPLPQCRGLGGQPR